MGKSFDELLQEGKSRAETGPQNKVRRWKECVNKLMDTIHELNALYEGKDSHHFVDVEAVNCKKCKQASFLVIVRDITKPKRTIRFHPSQWKSDGGDYYCDKCKV